MKKMSFFFSLMCVLGFFLSGIAVRADAPQRIAVMKSLDQMYDLWYDMVKTTERTDLPQIMEKAKSFLEKNGVLDIIDITQPAGAVCFIRNGEEMQLLAVPVKDLDKLREFVKKQDNIQVEENEKGTWKVKTHGKTLYVKKNTPWLIISEHEKALDTDMSLKDLFSALTEKYDSSISFYPDAMLPEKKEMYLAQIEKCLSRHMMHHMEKHGITEPTDTSKKVVSEIMKELKTGFNNLQCVTLGHFWCTKHKKETIRLCVTAKPGSCCAATWNKIAQPIPTQFAGFRDKDATFSFAKNGKIKLCDDLVSAYIKCMRSHMEKCVREHHEDEAEIKKILAHGERSLELIKNTLKDGNLDTAMLMNLDTDEAYALYARYVPDGYAVEKQIDEMIDYMKEKKDEDFNKHITNFKKTQHGNIHFTSFKIPVPEKCKGKERKNVLKLMDEDGIPITLGYGPKAFYFGVGHDAAEELLECVQNSGQIKAIPVEAHLNLMDLVEMASVCDKKPDVREKAQEFLKRVGGEDRIGDDDGRITLKLLPSENGFTVEICISTSAIKMIKGF